MRQKNPNPQYEVTKDGRVFSIETNWRCLGRREMRQHADRYGYPTVRIIVNGKRMTVTVHTLVAKAYLGPKPNPSDEVRHLDGNRMNSHYNNLAWGSRKENADDRERHGKTSRGSSHAAAIAAGKRQSVSQKREAAQ